MLNVDRKILKQLIVLATPMVISQGAFAVMTFTDRFFMSLISPTHMAASLGGGVAAFFCLSFFTGVLSYANALVAQYYGAGQWHKCSRVVTQSLMLCAISAPLLLLATWTVSGIFEWMGHDLLQVQLEQSYFLILMYGSVATLLKTSMASYFAGIGRTRIVMIADTLGVALNIPLSYALIFGKAGFPAMGIIGAAVGTIVSTVFTLVLFILFYLNRQHRIQFKVSTSFVIDTVIIKRYLRLGLPSGAEMFLDIAAFNLFLLMFQSYGVVEGASAAIVFNWDILSFIPLTGIEIAMMSLIGRYIGANDMTKLKQTITAGFLLSVGYAGALAIIFLTFRHSLVDLFIKPGEDYQAIHSLSVYMMLGLASYTIADALIIVVSAVLRGAGDTRWLMVASVGLHWLMLLIQYAVIKLLDFGPRISWLVFVCMILSAAVVFLLRLHGKKWQNPDVLKQVLDDN